MQEFSTTWKITISYTKVNIALGGPDPVRVLKQAFGKTGTVQKGICRKKVLLFPLVPGAKIQIWIVVV